MTESVFVETFFPKEITTQENFQRSLFPWEMVAKTNFPVQSSFLPTTTSGELLWKSRKRRFLDDFLSKHTSLQLQYPNNHSMSFWFAVEYVHFAVTPGLAPFFHEVRGFIAIPISRKESKNHCPVGLRRPRFFFESFPLWRRPNCSDSLTLTDPKNTFWTKTSRDCFLFFPDINSKKMGNPFVNTTDIIPQNPPLGAISIF